MRLTLLLLSLAAIPLLACSEGEATSDLAGQGLGNGKFDQALDAGPIDGGDTAHLGDTATLEDGLVDGLSEDPWALAKDVDLHHVVFPPHHVAPSAYDYPYSPVSGLSLGGTEFWQKWPGGESPTFSFSSGSSAGRRCMYASARRWEAIMKRMGDEVLELKVGSNWHGSFFNWNDDYSGGENPYGDGSGARLWAWRTTLIKWISQTNQDGSCYLPTLAMVKELIEVCLSHADVFDGEIKGCSARAD